MLDRVVFQHALRRIEAKIARLSAEMDLRSAEVIAFPQSRRRRSSNLLKLTQRADAKAGPQAQPRSKSKSKSKSRTSQRTWS
jgi:hypothetical protein